MIENTTIGGALVWLMGAVAMWALYRTTHDANFVSDANQWLVHAREDLDLPSARQMWTDVHGLGRDSIGAMAELFRVQ